MTAKIIDGKKISAELRQEIKARVSELAKRGIVPGLATILVGEDPASQLYVSSKIKACEEAGIKSFSHRLPGTATEAEIIKLIESLNNDPRVNGILLQLPLPKGLSSDRCLDAIDPAKDADGLHVKNLGKLLEAKSYQEILDKKLVLPCTPHGVIKLIEKMGIEISGKKAVVVGRSNLVGKPAAVLLLSKDATVTMAHSKTADLMHICNDADILIAAMGKPKFITKEFVKHGACVIDVGTNRQSSGLCGDVDFENVRDVAGFISPVPGGVGPMTITMLLNNAVLAAEKKAGGGVNR